MNQKQVIMIDINEKQLKELKELGSTIIIDKHIIVFIDRTPVMEDKTINE